MKVVYQVVLLLLALVFVNLPIYRAAHTLWNADMKMNLQRCTGHCNEKYCNISHICRPVNRTSKVKSLDIYFRSGIELETDLYVEIVAFKKFHNEYRQHMMQLKEELCSLLLYKNHTLFRLADDSLLARIKQGFYGNLLDPCPFVGRRYLKPRTTNSEDDAWHIPLVPVGEWRLDIIITKGGEHIVSFSDYYEITATGHKEF